MEAWDAICARRNVRHYKPDPVSEADLDRIAEAGWRAPSAKNRQPWDFVIVTDRTQLQELSTVWRGAGHIAAAAAAIAIVVPVPPDERRVHRQLRRRSGHDGDDDRGHRPGHRNRSLLGGRSGEGAGHPRRPDDHLVAFLLGIGYPADRPLTPIRKPDRKRPFAEVVHHGRRWCKGARGGPPR